MDFTFPSISSGEYRVVKPYFSIDLFDVDIVVQSNLADFD